MKIPGQFSAKINTLGLGSAESAEIARAAKAAGVRNAIGLQLRASPAVKKAHERLTSGAIGRLLSLSAYSSTAGFGPDVPAQFVYLEDPASFANLVTIQGAHTLDLVMGLGGKVGTLSALASRQFPVIWTGEERIRCKRTTYDHLLIQGRLAGGAPFTMEVAGGRKGETPFWLDLVGEKGTLRLDGGAPRGLQSGRIGLLENGERLAVDEGDLASLPDPAANVRGVYAELRDDIRAARAQPADFDHAARLSRLVEDALLSSDEQRQLTGGDWPAA